MSGDLRCRAIVTWLSVETTNRLWRWPTGGKKESVCVVSSVQVVTGEAEGWLNPQKTDAVQKQWKRDQGRGWSFYQSLRCADESAGQVKVELEEVVAGRWW